MSVLVSFASVKGVGSISVPAVSDCRVRETLTLGAGVTTAATEEYEVVFVLNNESAPIFIAFGTAPDATRTSKSNVSSAGVPVPAGALMAFNPPEGSKINARAVA